MVGLGVEISVHVCEFPSFRAGYRGMEGSVFLHLHGELDSWLYIVNMLQESFCCVLYDGACVIDISHLPPGSHWCRLQCQVFEVLHVQIDHCSRERRASCYTVPLLVARSVCYS